MRRNPKKPGSEVSIGESVETLSNAIAGFDFGVHSDDFILYELNRLIEEDRASFEDEEFRILIDEGIREHVEENLQIRAQLAGRLRTVARNMDADIQTVARRVIRVLENTGYDLRNAGLVVRTYTGYLFDKLQSLDEVGDKEAMAREWIHAWRSGERPSVSDRQLISDLQAMGRAALGPVSELLVLSPDDRRSSETALAVLSHVRSSVSARVLAYAVSEPMLDEDLEAQAYTALRAFWPLARPYMLHSLHSHAHEDLPFRWFQLLIEVNEITASELVYEEMRVHGDKPNYHEDLWALASLLAHSHDPELEDKVLEWINNPQTPQPVVPMLREFLKEYQPGTRNADQDPWAEHKRLLNLNTEYIAASSLFDAGQTGEAQLGLQKILAQAPDYPFAVMLSELMKASHQ